MSVSRVLGVLWIAVCLAVLGGCFDPSYPSNIPCSENQTCPPGRRCDVDGICRIEPLPPPSPDAAPDTAPDAAPDGAPACLNDDACGDGQICGADGACVTPSCVDGLRNGDESDLDCGGTSCPPCGDGASCGRSDDCASGECSPDGICDPRCGDGFTNPAADEACDTAGNSATCDADCTAVVCGDGITNPAAGENCDDGNGIGGDGCSATCRREVELTVGFYDMALGQGSSLQVPPIESVGGIPVDVIELSAEELAGLGVLFVQNPSNDFFGDEYPSQIPLVAEAVAAGLILVIHDRFVDTAQTILPGGSNIQCIRDFEDGANIDILDDSTLVTSGPAGTLDNDSLDNGTSSSHGFMVSDSLPAGAIQILTRSNPQEIVTMCYPFGAGAVVYSTIPLDHYLIGASPESFRVIYAPNVVAYALDGACISAR